MLGSPIALVHTSSHLLKVGSTPALSPLGGGELPPDAQIRNLPWAMSFLVRRYCTAEQLYFLRPQQCCSLGNAAGHRMLGTAGCAGSNPAPGYIFLSLASAWNPCFFTLL